MTYPLVAFLTCCLLALLLSACVRPAPTVTPWYQPPTGGNGLLAPVQPTLPESLSTRQAASPDPTAVTPPGASPTPFSSPTPYPVEIGTSPTPDAPRVMPTLRTETQTYVVQTGDALGKIAQRFQVSLKQLIEANPTINPDILYVGAQLTVPPPNPGAAGPDFKILPDSELVYGPSSAQFNAADFIRQHAGYLSSYHELVDDQDVSGPEILQRVAQLYSVNPRLLIAALEYQCGWLTSSNPGERDYPMGARDVWRKGLFHQLSWAADTLNAGYYRWRAGSASIWNLADGSVVPIAPTINAGTAGVQNLFATLKDRAAWQTAVGQAGIFATYARLFGNPFAFTFEPILPPGLQQPVLHLPFEPGVAWSFTGGPHGGWGNGSAWAAVDFAPPGDQFGCYLSSAWVVAMADGLIVRSEGGLVVQDLDGDGLEQTGWTILYAHIDSQDRVPAGTLLKAGDRIGHPSCEGGISDGTHTHLVRRYNGEWIPADGNLPFVMDGWVSSGDSIEYGGYLTNNEQTIEAYNGRTEANQIWR
ncbi:MAG: LysM peptidoglycan-binding domain-containing protein [Anaerolineaceae bacterium]|nr:LysM peptidoglycan-binding domain-containing protein [Anaerolineaceae bacterium]